MKQQARILFFLFFCLLIGAPVFAQKKKENYHENQNPFGKKRKEKKNQSKALSKRGGGLFKKKHSAGNADAFAGNSITGGKGFLSKIFGGGKSSTKNASLRKTRPGKVQDRENSRLFKRNRTSTKKQNGSFLNRQNKQRNKTRKRGNSSFQGKKH